MWMLGLGRTLGLGLIRIGVLIGESDYASRRCVGAGAYLANPRFSGGGSADLTCECQLGAGLGTANKRFRFMPNTNFRGSTVRWASTTSRFS